MSAAANAKRVEDSIDDDDRAEPSVQIQGALGYMRGTKSERTYREVKVMMIGGAAAAAAEIMKESAARQLGV